MRAVVQLRDVVDEDLPVFFEFQSDPEAQRLASIPARTREDFDAHWAKIRADESIRIQTVLVNGKVVGNVLTFDRDEHREVGYWIARAWWGRGVASRALALFLDRIATRPLYGHVAKTNAASIRVLEKCGFTIVGEDKEFSKVGDDFVEGVILRLD